MSSINFDTHFFIKNLEKNGFTENQAESVVRLVSGVCEEATEKLATKDDLIKISEITKNDLIKFSELTKNDLIKFSELARKDIELLESRMTNKMGGMIIALAGFLVAIKFFGH